MWAGGGGVCRSEQLEEQPIPTAYAEPWALFTLSLPLAPPPSSAATEERECCPFLVVGAGSRG